MLRKTAFEVVKHMPRRAVTALAGRISEKTVPHWARSATWRGYGALVGADLSEASQELESYENFDAFFTRALRDGIRPIDTQCAAIYPCDGRLDQVGPITRGQLIQAKGIHYSATELLGNVTEGGLFEGGSFATVYLSPADYHRVHAPIAMKIDKIRHLGGDLWPVNGLSVPRVDGLFVQNERVVFSGAGPDGVAVAVVMVGAIVVGRISVAYADFDLSARQPGEVRTFRPEGGWQVERGEELGSFRLGSTTIILVGPHSRPWDAVDVTGARARLGRALFR